MCNGPVIQPIYFEILQFEVDIPIYFMIHRMALDERFIYVVLYLLQID